MTIQKQTFPIHHGNRGGTQLSLGECRVCRFNSKVNDTLALVMKAQTACEFILHFHEAFCLRCTSLSCYDLQ